MFALELTLRRRRWASSADDDAIDEEDEYDPLPAFINGR
jgi:hypothetical protein